MRRPHGLLPRQDVSGCYFVVLASPFRLSRGQICPSYTETRGRHDRRRSLVERDSRLGKSGDAAAVEAADRKASG